MISKFKRFVFAAILAGLMCSPTACVKNIESHKMEYHEWLQEQVEKGYLTQEEADQYEKEIKVIHMK